MVRDKCTTKPALDAGLLPGRPDMSDGFFWTDRALEVRRISDELAYESLQALQLFRSGFGYALTKRSRYCNFKRQEGIHTISMAAHFHQTRADTQEEHTIFLILRVELGYDNVHGCLRGRV